MKTYLYRITLRSDAGSCEFRLRARTEERARRAVRLLVARRWLGVDEYDDETAVERLDYVAELRVWSRVGHTPLTGRAGNFCDLLETRRVPVSGPADARRQLAHMARHRQSADKGHVFIADFPNQNQRTQWVSGRAALLQRPSYVPTDAPPAELPAVVIGPEPHAPANGIQLRTSSPATPCA